MYDDELELRVCPMCNAFFVPKHRNQKYCDSGECYPQKAYKRKKLLKNKETAKTQRLDCFLKCIFYKQQGSVFSKHTALLLHAPYRDGKAADIEIGFCVILCCLWGTKKMDLRF